MKKSPLCDKSKDWFTVVFSNSTCLVLDNKDLLP